MKAMESGWLKILDLRGPNAFVDLTVCAGISVGANRDWLAFNNAPSGLIIGANVGCLLFGALTLLWIGELATQPFKRATNLRRRRKALESAFQGLSLEEYNTLKGVADRRQKSTTASIIAPVMHSLTAKRLLVKRSRHGNISSWTCLMPNDVFEYIMTKLS